MALTLSEIHALAADFINTASLLAKRFPQARFVVPAANAQVARAFQQQLAQQPHAPEMLCLQGQTDDVLAASDVALIACGTATLEALLYQCPMVAAYRLNRWTYRVLKSLRLVRSRYFALPNLLADEKLVPEFIQDQVQPLAMADALSSLLNNAASRLYCRQRFRQIHEQLQCHSAERAADAVVGVINN
ncbi:MAG: hypothetical protein KZQ58_11040 [gamma proteobacterium symbiont of Bathyaustriella thionipta]|nr:hypothetical protein [gamma proteobacterium symbiont of Bathyaustriella thionipta]